MKVVWDGIELMQASVFDEVRRKKRQYRQHVQAHSMDAMHVELNKIYRLPDLTLGDEKDYDSYKGTNESGEMQRSI